MSPPDADLLARRLADLRAEVVARSPHPDRVRVIGVTKGFGGQVARALVHAGVRDLGENYAQELARKAEAVPDATWHFLGPVQRNKLRALAPLVDCWHGVDRLEVGEGIARRRPGAQVLVQVNASGAVHRPGVPWDDAPGLIASLRDLDLDVVGLMAVATQGPPDAARSQFARLAMMAGELGLRELSMGMSADFHEALEAGATMIRIGTALLGERPRPTQATE